MQSIYKYIISLLACLALYPVQAQEKQGPPQEKSTEEQKKKEKLEMPKEKLFNGFTVMVDAASVVTTAFIPGETYSMEGAIQFNLRKKYFPVFELGVAGADKLSSDNVGFKTSGLFERIGIDMSMIKKKPDSKPTSNLFLLGARIGMSNFTYDMTNLQIDDEYWGGSETINYMNQNSTKIWFEVVASVQVEIVKNIFMGWTVRDKNLFKVDASGTVFPAYIPGFGLNTSTNWSLNYTIGYHF